MSKRLPEANEPEQVCSVHKDIKKDLKIIKWACITLLVSIYLPIGVALTVALVSKILVAHGGN